MQGLQFLIDYFESLQNLTLRLRMAFEEVVTEAGGIINQEFIDDKVTAQVIEIMGIEDNTLEKMMELAKYLNSVREGKIPDETS